MINIHKGDKIMENNTNFDVKINTIQNWISNGLYDIYYQLFTDKVEIGDEITAIVCGFDADEFVYSYTQIHSENLADFWSMINRRVDLIELFEDYRKTCPAVKSLIFKDKETASHFADIFKKKMIRNEQDERLLYILNTITVDEICHLMYHHILKNINITR